MNQELTITDDEINFDTIKRWKKEFGVKSIEDLIVLARVNDPFYVGEKSKRILAEWFAGIWNDLDIQSKVHLRRLHYQIVSQKKRPVMPDAIGWNKEIRGKPNPLYGSHYENSEPCWGTLQLASKYARYLDLVDPRMIEDRRNPKPIIYHYEREEEYSIDVISDDWGFELPKFPELPEYDVTGFESEQRYHLEIWCEKSTMNEILIPVCREYRADLITAVGEISTSNCCKAVDERFYEIERPIRIFYISDFDPAGRSMPVAAARKFEYFIHKYQSDLDVRVFPIVLTEEQVKKFKLPRVPIKSSEIRKGRFEEKFGEGAVELDALEALYPGKLREIIEEHFNHYYDHKLSSKESRACRDLENEFDRIQEEISEEHEEEIDALREEHGKLTKELSEKFEDLKERQENVWLTIRSELEERIPDVKEYPIPEGAESEDFQEPLYSSDRHYLEQLNFYKDYQGKSGIRFKIKDKA